MKTENTMMNEHQDFNWGSKTELILIIAISILAGLIAKIPHIFSVTEDFFYMRNIGFIALPGLSVYFAWRNKFSIIKMGALVLIVALSVVYINTLNSDDTSDTLILACIHMVIINAAIVGISYVNDYKNNIEKRILFLKYIGDLLVMCALIMIAGGMLSGMTIGLFSVIGMKIEDFYFQNIAIWGISALPIIGTYIVINNPTLVGKVSPIIAKIFSPIVLFMLVVYLIAIVSTGKDPYNDREFLLIFNLLLIGVLALIFFGITGSSTTKINQFQSWVLFLLSCVTIVVCGIALSAIMFRIAEWGVTPNRLAVLGSNVLIFTHLMLVALQLYKYTTENKGLMLVEKTISIYLPVYFIWSLVVTFLFPLIW